MVVIPIAGPDDLIDDAQSGELAMQAVARGTSFVTGNDLPPAGDLLLNPSEQVLGYQALRGFGAGAIVLHGHDVPGEVHVQRKLKRASLWLRVLDNGSRD